MAHHALLTVVAPFCFWMLLSTERWSVLARHFRHLPCLPQDCCHHADSLSIRSYVTAVTWNWERGTKAGGPPSKSCWGPIREEFLNIRCCCLIPPWKTKKTHWPNPYSCITSIQMRPWRVWPWSVFEMACWSCAVRQAATIKWTRFYTFYPVHKSSFYMVMANKVHTSLAEPLIWPWWTCQKRTWQKL
jgi:hypothetical protein